VQRMNSYAIYRIAETLRVLLFVTLAILVFNFFPVTAIMIVVLALLNDGSILSIAYDNVHYKNQPEAWNMRLVIGMATVLGVIGPIAAFGLFLIGDEIFHLGHPQLQTLMYLMLSVAGSMTIYLTRTRGPFWSIRPARILVLAVTGAELIATALALSGILVPRLGWNWVLLVWGYAMVWFLITDRVKLAAYKILDPVKNQGTAHAGPPVAEPVSHPDLGQEATPAAKRAAFHTAADPGDGVYHDSGDCPYGQEIRRDRNDEPGTGGGRRCEWCARHPVSA
jgi:H+-transporting ATPase